MKINFCCIFIIFVISSVIAHGIDSQGQHIILHDDLNVSSIDSLLSNWKEFSDITCWTDIIKNQEISELDSNFIRNFSISSKTFKIFPNKSNKIDKYFIIVKSQYIIKDSSITDNYSEKRQISFYSILEFCLIQKNWQLFLLNKAVYVYNEIENPEGSDVEKVLALKLNENDFCFAFTAWNGLFGSMNSAMSAEFFIKIDSNYRNIYRYTCYYDEFFSIENLKQYPKLLKIVNKNIGQIDANSKKIKIEIDSLENLHNSEISDKIDSLNNKFDEQTNVIIGCDIDFKVSINKNYFKLKCTYNWFVTYEINLDKRKHFKITKNSIKGKIEKVNDNDIVSYVLNLYENEKDGFDYGGFDYCESMIQTLIGD
jgi:hypothetical protein